MQKLLTIEEVAERMGLTVSVIRNLIYKGRFPYVKIGASTRVLEASLDTFIQISERVTAEIAAENSRREAA